MEPKTLDHVAFWVADRDRIADFCCAHLGMHVIAREDSFTLVGSDARRGKLTLFDAEGPRAPGAFRRVGLRVSDLPAALAQLPEGTGEEFEISEGVRIRLVEAPTDVEYDLDHAALYASDPEAALEEYVSLGFDPAAPGADGAAAGRGRRRLRRAPSPATPARPRSRCSTTSRCWWTPRRT